MGSTRSNYKGFTLIEILVVVLILSLIAGFVTFYIMDRPDDARLVKAQQDVEAIERALEL